MESITELTASKKIILETKMPFIIEIGTDKIYLTNITWDYFDHDYKMSINKYENDKICSMILDYDNTIHIIDNIRNVPSHVPKNKKCHEMFYFKKKIRISICYKNKIYFGEIDISAESERNFFWIENFYKKFKQILGKSKLEEIFDKYNLNILLEHENIKKDIKELIKKKQSKKIFKYGCNEFGITEISKYTYLKILFDYKDETLGYIQINYKDIKTGEYVRKRPVIDKDNYISINLSEYNSFWITDENKNIKKWKIKDIKFIC